MKLILTQEVDGLGAPGDVVEVKDGYGRNYLVPRGLGIRWTRGGEKTVESIKTARTARAARDADHAKEIKTKIEATPVAVKVRSGAGGRLFGAVTTAEIADAITEVLRRAGRPPHDRGRPAHQGARCPRGVGQAARRGVGHGRPQRDPRLTHHSTARAARSLRGAGRAAFRGGPPPVGCFPRCSGDPDALLAVASASNRQGRPVSTAAQSPCADVGPGQHGVDLDRPAAGSAPRRRPSRAGCRRTGRSPRSPAASPSPGPGRRSASRSCRPGRAPCRTTARSAHRGGARRPAGPQHEAGALPPADQDGAVEGRGGLPALSIRRGAQVGGHEEGERLGPGARRTGPVDTPARVKTWSPEATPASTQAPGCTRWPRRRGGTRSAASRSLLLSRIGTRRDGTTGRCGVCSSYASGVTKATGAAVSCLQPTVAGVASRSSPGSSSVERQQRVGGVGAAPVGDVDGADLEGVRLLGVDEPGVGARAGAGRPVVRLRRPGEPALEAQRVGVGVGVRRREGEGHARRRHPPGGVGRRRHPGQGRLRRDGVVAPGTQEGGRLVGEAARGGVRRGRRARREADGEQGRGQHGGGEGGGPAGGGSWALRGR